MIPPAPFPYQRARAGIRLSARLAARIHFVPLGSGTRSRASLPSTDRDWIENQQQLTTEIREFRRVGGRFDFSGLLDVTKLVEKSRIAGAALETTEIRDVVLVVDRAAEWREIALNPPAAMKVRVEGGGRAFRAASPTSPTSCAAFATRFCPTARSTIALRRNWRAFAARSKSRDAQIQESLRGYLRRLSEGGAVQDELVTIRGERFVIPSQGRAEAARAGRGARSQFQRANGFRRTAGNHRAEQRTGAAARRRAGGDSSHSAGDDAAHRRAARRRSSPRRSPGRTGAAVCQGALCGRLQLRSGSSVLETSARAVEQRSTRSCATRGIRCSNAI